MKRFLKWLLWVIVSIILILIITFALLTFLVKPNDLKPLLSNQIYKATGQQVIFNGDIHWQVFPTLSIKIDNVVINNPPGFDSAPLAQIKQLSVGIEILPLLHKQIKTTELLLGNATVNLVKNKNGTTNWNVKQAAPATTPTAVTKNEQTPSNKNNSDSISLEIPTVQIQNMNLTFQNQQNNQTTKINQLNLTAKNIQRGEAFPITLSFNISNNKPDINGAISLSSKITMRPSNTYLLQNLNLKTNLRGDGLPQGKLNISLNGDAIITPNSAEINPLNLKLNASQVSGNLAVTDFTRMATNFNLKAQPFNYDNLSGNATIKGNLTAATPATTPALNQLNGNISLDVNNGAYQGINIPFFVNTALALIDKQTPAPMTGGNQTTFDNLHASFSIKNGTAYNQDFRISSPIINATGSGNINLVAQTISFGLLISSATSNNIYAQNIPLNISGTLSKPTASLDTTRILQKVLKNEAQKQLGNVINELTSKLFQ